MKILFAGTPEIAVPSLKQLSETFEVCGVLTAPDRPSGRGRKIVASPVKQLAEELGIPVLQPPSLGRSARESVAALKPDLMAVAAYSRIFGPKFLSLFPKGSVNLHPSLLPLHRGPSPLPAAILAGDTVTGITVQYVGLKMDAGDILLQSRVEIGENETTGELADRVAPIGAEMMVEAISGIASGTASPKAQNHADATYCSLIQKTDGLITWAATAEEISRKVRAYNPWPIVYTSWKGTKLSIIRAAVYGGTASFGKASPGTVLGVDKASGILIQTKHGILTAEELQLQARKALGWKSFLNGTQDFVGSVLGGD